MGMRVRVWCRRHQSVLTFVWAMVVLVSIPALVSAQVADPFSKGFANLLGWLAAWSYYIVAIGFFGAAASGIGGERGAMGVFVIVLIFGAICMAAPKLASAWETMFSLGLVGL